MDYHSLSTSQVCSLLSISLSSFYRYCKNGLLKPIFFTPGGHRRFSFLDISQTFSISPSNNLIVTYARVSSADQKADLSRQSSKLNDFALSFNLNNSLNLDILNITDLGSGLNYKKKGLNQLILLIISRKINTLIINHKDRLLRFGSEIIFKLCSYFNVKVIILEQKIEQSFEFELSSDVIELMTVFCPKLYDKRSHKNKKVIA